MRKIYSIMALGLIVAAGCSDLLENDLPDNEIPKKDAIRSAKDMQELMNAAYDVVANSFHGNNQRFSELLGDNVFISGNGTLVQVYNRSSDFFNADVAGYYKEPYIAIGRANTVLENLDAVQLTEEERNRFEGEAKFIRAMCHFEHVRLFAQPYGYTSDNSHLGIVIKTTSKIEPAQRSTVAEVYDQVIKDFEEAEALLPPTNDVYASRYSATAYLARVYFQMNDFERAVSKAEEALASPHHQFSTDINNRFTTSVSPEAFLTLVNAADNEVRTRLFRDSYRSINTNPTAGPDKTEEIAAPTLRVSSDLFNLLTSAASDKRSNWVAEKVYQTGEETVLTRFDSSYFNASHITVTEMLLIAAESYGELNRELSTAAGYLNLIKDRAEVPLVTIPPSAETVIVESRVERRKEFVGEGHRLHELKRLGVLGENVIVRGAPWNCDGMVLQFPASEQSTLGFTMNPQGGCN